MLRLHSFHILVMPKSTVWQYLALWFLQSSTPSSPDFSCRAVFGCTNWGWELHDLLFYSLYTYVCLIDIHVNADLCLSQVACSSQRATFENLLALSPMCSEDQTQPLGLSQQTLLHAKPSQALVL